MIQLVAPGLYDAFRDELAEMFRLRCKVFKERLGWAVEIHGDQERDRFDDLGPHYLLQRWEGSLIGCVRFLPTIGPTMLRDTFSELLDGRPMPENPGIWESSRFAIDPPESLLARNGGLSRSTFELFAGMIEFGLVRGLTRIVTVTDTRMERILRRAVWPLARLGEPCQVGATTTVAGFLEVTREALARVQSLGGFRQPVLWRPGNNVLDA